MRMLRGPGPSSQGWGPRRHRLRTRTASEPRVKSLRPCNPEPSQPASPRGIAVISDNPAYRSFSTFLSQSSGPGGLTRTHSWPNAWGGGPTSPPPPARTGNLGARSCVRGSSSNGRPRPPPRPLAAATGNLCRRWRRRPGQWAGRPGPPKRLATRPSQLACQQ